MTHKGWSGPLLFVWALFNPCDLPMFHKSDFGRLFIQLAVCKLRGDHVVVVAALFVLSLQAQTFWYLSFFKGGSLFTFELVMDMIIFLFLVFICIRIHIIDFSVSFIIAIMYFFGTLFPLLLFTYWNPSTIKLFNSSMTVMRFSFSHFYFLLFYTFSGIYFISFFPFLTLIFVFCRTAVTCGFLW